MARKNLKKSTRFEVFKRDSFTCQYCGKSAPDVVLHVDHIKPVVKGGDNDLLNLITSCAACNLGKGARELSDDSIVKKQREQLEELAERHQQLEMLIEWREGMSDLDDRKLDVLINLFQEHAGDGVEITNAGIKNLKSWMRKHSFNILYDSIIDSCAQYKDDEKKFNMISRIAYRKENPLSEDDQFLFYIRGILRNRFNFINEWKTIELLREAVDAGAPYEELSDVAKSVQSWTDFVNYIEERLGR